MQHFGHSSRPSHLHPSHLEDHQTCPRRDKKHHVPFRSFPQVSSLKRVSKGSYATAFFRFPVWSLTAFGGEGCFFESKCLKSGNREEIAEVKGGLDKLIFVKWLLSETSSLSSRSSMNSRGATSGCACLPYLEPLRKGDQASPWPPITKSHNDVSPTSVDTLPVHT